MSVSKRKTEEHVKNSWINKNWIRQILGYINKGEDREEYGTGKWKTENGRRTTGKGN